MTPEILWSYTPPASPSLLPTDFFTLFSGVASIVSLFLALGASIRRIWRRRKQQEVSDRGVIVIVLSSLAFTAFLTITTYRVRTTVHGSREVHYKVTSEALGIALDDRYFEAAIDSFGAVLVTDRMTIRNASTSDRQGHFELRYSLPDHPGMNPASLVKGPVRSIPCGAGHKLKLTTRPVREVYLTAVEIYPPLKPGEAVPMLEALHKSAPPRTMAMTAREATRRDSTRRTQSVAFEVRYPTSQLTLKVIMPPGFEPSDARPVVWYGQARVPHEAELFHLRSHDSQGFAATPNVDFERRMEMTLVVDYPLMGLTYGVEWVPPDDWR